MSDGRLTEADYDNITAADMAMLDFASEVATDDINYSDLMIDDDA